MVPKHIGFILDGNRRLAKRLMVKPWKGHEWGKDKVLKVLDWTKKLGVEEITFYALSIQNLGRPKQELDHIMRLAQEGFEELKTKAADLKEEGVRINIIGRTQLLPASLQQTIKELMELTKNNTKRMVNFALAYGGREEVIDAVTNIAKQVKEGKLDIDAINEESFSENLYSKGEPDLIIRTGGDKRTSNFLPWQSIYSEWFFLDKFWPEFEEADLLAVVEEYGQRERRHGK
ncbi:MAG: polyprenyl diphosphate synthase [Candidatus Woesearchaeota archaeon]|jgi:tritrans,polycis-undecaprenyl-diphosphate synthase [geranylgeranyl-diphosphate specific]|nr:polyprenyl diphosphate synthase [Candidatus Woesearchaeota archaeon]MDP7181640.1 polyprenyl diphosphate synthase [Candidatus Woesearchaeota archaeon]MDP7198729.1 polyprenyl diphosphate synthase [Candidatus Woesearchaeota archaeon]MDP7467271.1 polyprenyl diphosphate synthase [Candidatus Woesearchaeota archaeon]MDP7647394.1 polyprenyl diphosphate synthase [Candidatus Woesearchaeota archaeon]